MAVGLEGVAPLAGAWIETSDLDYFNAAIEVAPLAGAWIETKTATSAAKGRLRSLPSRERGLKLKLFLIDARHQASLPSRERGLKLKRER